MELEIQVMIGEDWQDARDHVTVFESPLDLSSESCAMRGMERYYSTGALQSVGILIHGGGCSSPLCWFHNVTHFSITICIYLFLV